MSVNNVYFRRKKRAAFQPGKVLESGILGEEGTRRLLLLIYTLWKNGEEYDPMRDKTHTHQKKMKEEDTELEYEPEDCIGPKHDPADWNATDEHGNPPF